MSLTRATSLESGEPQRSSHAESNPNSKKRRFSTTSRSSSTDKLDSNSVAGSPWGGSVTNDDTRDDEMQNEGSPLNGGRGHDRSDGKEKSPNGLSPFNVPKWKRTAQVCVAVGYCLLSTGIVFGYAALKPLLVKEGVYRDKCSDEELQNGETICYGQDLRLNFMFTLAVVSTNVCALPSGTVLDIYGPRIGGVIGSVLLGSGVLLFALGSHLPFDGYVSGYLLIALGGSFIFISSFQLSNTFPKHSGLILSLLTGAFDASSSLFLLFRVLHGGFFTISTLFSIYLIVPCFIFAFQMFLMPPVSYKGRGELIQEAKELAAENSGIISEARGFHDDDEQSRRDISHRQALIENVKDLVEDENNQDLTSSDPQSKPAIEGVMQSASALQQIRSLWFILISIFALLQMLRINYFVATIHTQYEYLLDSYPLATKLNHIFDIFLPLGGVIAVPFIGSILDKSSMPMILTVLVSGATLIGVLGCIPRSQLAAYGNICLFALYRPYFYTTMSDYAAKVFGFQTFGKVYGLVICIAGLGNFIQAPLDIATFKVFHGNPIPLNAILTVTGFVAGGMLVLFVCWQARVRRSELESVAEEGDIGSSGNYTSPTRRDRSPNETDRLLPDH